MEWEKLARFRAECFLKKEDPLAAEGQNICAKKSVRKRWDTVCVVGKQGCCGRKTLQANLRPRKRGRQNGWKAREATKGAPVSKLFHSKSLTAQNQRQTLTAQNRRNDPAEGARGKDMGVELPWNKPAGRKSTRQRLSGSKARSTPALPVETRKRKAQMSPPESSKETRQKELCLSALQRQNRLCRPLFRREKGKSGIT